MHAFLSIDPSHYSRVFVLGPSHRLAINYCALPDATSAETPFGELPIDVSVSQNLLSNFPNLFRKLDRPTFENEHSMEMQFPLLKYVFGKKDITIIPIMVGDLSLQQTKDVAAILREFTDDEGTLVIISSDFCHWGKNYRYTFLPDGTLPVYQKIEQIDRSAALLIGRGDADKFAKFLSETGATICGRNAILIAMGLYDQYRAEFPAYSQSSRAISEEDSSVSYLAGIIRNSD
jgi:AmmeMemoRadiSam system protein B